jgi:hypothetical protein
MIGKTGVPGSSGMIRTSRGSSGPVEAEFNGT